ncbi:heme o synthase [Chloroflexota bacterium]
MNQVESAPLPMRDELPAAAASAASVPLWKSLSVLFKARVVVLLLLAAVGGAFLAAGGWPGWATLGILLIAGGLAAGGASAINEYLESELDARMERTRDRPLAAESFPFPRWVPYVGVAMILVPSVVLLPFNPQLTFFLLLGAIIYIAVYTVWLKPRTPFNIVIGGAAGSAAVLSGSAAAGCWNEPGALLLALVVLLWTPSHFWSLAVAYRADYARGGFPMLPVQSTLRAAARWVMFHTTAASLAALALALHPGLGWVYFVPVALATVYLLARNVQFLADQGRRRALRVFGASNLYLAVVLIMVCVATAVS